jgi:hypothetical protein
MENRGWVYLCPGKKRPNPSKRVDGFLRFLAAKLKAWKMQIDWGDFRPKFGGELKA